jgi:hypothetical protein
LSPAVADVRIGTCSVSKVPEAITFWLTPKIMIVQVLPLRLSLTCLFAADTPIMAPGVIVPVLNPAGNVRLNCRPVTAAEPALKVTGKLTLLPVFPDALPTDNVGVVEVGAVTVSVKVRVPVPPAFVALRLTEDVPAAVGVPEI